MIFDEGSFGFGEGIFIFCFDKIFSKNGIQIEPAMELGFDTDYISFFQSIFLSLVLQI